jgi:hypothetical protein
MLPTSPQVAGRYMDHIVREAVEVVFHPFNMNNEDGFVSIDRGNILFSP